MENTVSWFIKQKSDRFCMQISFDISSAVLSFTKFFFQINKKHNRFFVFYSHVMRRGKIWWRKMDNIKDKMKIDFSKQEKRGTKPTRFQPFITNISREWCFKRKIYVSTCSLKILRISHLCLYSQIKIFLGHGKEHTAAVFLFSFLPT